MRRSCAVAWIACVVGFASGAGAATDWTFAGATPLVGSNIGELLSRTSLGSAIASRAARVLELTDVQAETLESLRYASESAWLETAVEIRERYYDRMQGKWIPEYRELERADNDELCRSLAGVQARFLADFQLVLTESQQRNWDAFERDLIRLSTLGRFATYDLEALDLIAYTDALDLDERHRAIVAPILAEYAGTLDPILRERNRIAEDLGAKALALAALKAEAQLDMYIAQAEGREPIVVPDQHLKEVNRLSVDQLARCERIRDLNARTAAALCDALPSEAASELRDTVDRCDDPTRTMHGSATGIGPVDQAFGLLAAVAPDRFRSDNPFDDDPSWLRSHSAVQGVRAEPLTPEQMERLREIRTRFIEQRDEINSRSLGAIFGSSIGGHRRLRTPVAIINIASESDRRPISTADREQIRALQQDLERETIGKIRDVLTIRQRALIVLW